MDEADGATLWLINLQKRICLENVRTNICPILEGLPLPTVPWFSLACSLEDPSRNDSDNLVGLHGLQHGVT